MTATMPRQARTLQASCCNCQAFAFVSAPSCVQELPATTSSWNMVCMCNRAKPRQRHLFNRYPKRRNHTVQPGCEQHVLQYHCCQQGRGIHVLIGRAQLAGFCQQAAMDCGCTSKDLHQLSMVDGPFLPITEAPVLPDILTG